MDVSTVVAGRFRVEKLAGRGGMGSVYLATDLLESGPIALKVVEGSSSEEARRFAREGRVLSSLAHPAIVRYTAHGQLDDGRLYLAMEWLEGQDLDARLSAGGLRLGETVRLGVRIAEALGAVHDAGIVHRDLKPANILLPGGDVDQAKLVDFGIASVSRTLHGTSNKLTAPNMVLGTPGYLSPEQIRGAKVTNKADLFALGCVLFECITGQPAFSGDELLALLTRILLEPAPRLRDVRSDAPLIVDALIADLLEKDPDKRPSDAHEVATRLRDMKHATGAPASRPIVASITPRELRLVSVVVAGASHSEVETATGATMARASADDLRASVDALARAHGARAEVMLDGAVVALVEFGSTPAELAMRAARLALAMRVLLPAAPIVVATGRAVVSQSLPVGRTIERAVREVKEAPPGAVMLDAETASLLEGRFHIETKGDRALLLSEARPGVSERTLLGRPMPCVGRRRELALLVSTLEECVEEGCARGVLVTSDAGMGKSRLMRELVSKANASFSDLRVFSLFADPMRTGSAYGMLGPALRAALGVNEADTLEQRRVQVRKQVAHRVPEGDRERVATFLGELAGIHFVDAESPALQAARFDPRLMGDQMRAAFLDWMKAECAEGPRLIVLEDLHWADLSTIRLVGETLAALEKAPLMILALARPTVKELAPKLWEDHNVTELTLGRLSTRAAEELVRAALGDTQPEETVRLIVERADGNALFLEELIRAAAAGHSTGLPDTVLGVVEARLAELDPDARFVLRAASVFGESFWAGGVNTLLGKVGAANGWLGSLVDAEIITASASTRFADEKEYAFRHGLVRDACYAMLTSEDRVAGHRLAAEWLDSNGEDDAAILAEHFERAGESEQAIRHFLRATANAMAGGDLRAVVRLAERGVALGAAGAMLGGLRSLMCDALAWLGEPARAKELGLEALALLDERSPPWWSTLGGLADACTMACDWAGVEEHRDAAVRFVTSQPDYSESCLIAVGRLAAGLTLSARPSEAAQLLGALVDTPRPSLSPLVIGTLEHARGLTAASERDLERSLAHYRRAAEAFQAAGAKRLAAASLTNAGGMLTDHGSFPAAVRELTMAVADGLTAGSPYIVAIAQLNLAIAQAPNDPSASRSAFTQAIEAFRRQGDARLEASARCALAELVLESGDVAGARGEIDRALDVARGLETSYAAALAVSARVSLSEGKPERALSATREGLALAAHAPLEEREMLLGLCHAESLHATGDRAGAATFLRDLRDRLQGQAKGIQSSELRESFLAAVPTHTRILALAFAWDVDGQGVSRPSVDAL